jgi:SAM-dependent methyltransferase
MTDEEGTTFKDTLLRNRFIPVPPLDRNFVSLNPIDFLAEGIDLMRLLTKAGLQPHHSVLDLGCGIGRLALPLTQYLSEEGYYLGLDINLSGIAWAHENITCRYPRFEFVVLNARNVHYGARHEYGQDELVQSSLPIADYLHFDVAAAMSLFTHLTWDELVWYFRKLTKLLKPGGVLVGTFFLMTERARASIRAGNCPIPFDMDAPGPSYYAKDANGRFTAFAHDEGAFRDLIASCGMEICSDSWRSGWEETATCADIMVLSNGQRTVVPTQVALPLSEPSAIQPTANEPVMAQGWWNRLEWQDDNHLRIADTAFTLTSTDYTLQSTPGHFVMLKGRQMLSTYGDILGTSTPRKMLEIGLFQGGSTVFFDLALRPDLIVAVDLHHSAPVLEDYIAAHRRRDAIKIEYGVEQSDRLSLSRVLLTHFPNCDIDLIVDDASHLYDQTRVSFEMCFPYLREGGLYLIEDWSWAHWPEEWLQKDMLTGPALSNLVFELTMMHASNPELVAGLRIERDMVAIVRGPGRLPTDGSFRIDDNYRTRGRVLNKI